MSIYKPSLLDKFKDFVNGLKGNWDAYEDHVADTVTDNVHGLKLDNPTSATLTNGWTNQSISTYGPARYFKDAFGIVHVKATVKAPASDRTLAMFTLPEGYRPAYQLRIPVINQSQSSVIYALVSTSGEVSIPVTTGEGDIITLHICFRAGD